MVIKKPWALALVASCAIFLAPVGQVLADEVVLENGDRLTGTVMRVEGGKLILKSEYAGEISIPVEKVKTLAMDGPAEVHLSSGEVIKGKIKITEGGRVAVEPTPEREATSFDWKKVASVNPPPQKWKGNINVGASTQSGNTDRKSAAVGAEATRRTDQDRFSLRFLFNYAEDETDVTSRNTFGAAKYDYFFTPKFYGYLAIDLLNDKFKDYRLKTAVGPGVGYQIWDDPVKSLGVEAGLSYIWEDHYVGEDVDYPAARLGADFRWNIFKFLTFTDRLVVYPNLRNGGDYLLRNEAALISPLGSGWALRLANIWDRDSDPPPGFDKDDFTTILGLQYAF
jgi:putative salt-induced outer membrane protein YdiY